MQVRGGGVLVRGAAMVVGNGGANGGRKMVVCETAVVVAVRRSAMEARQFASRWQFPWLLREEEVARRREDGGGARRLLLPLVLLLRFPA